MGKAYGDTMGGYFGAKQVPLQVHSAALPNDVAVTYMRCDGPGTGLTAPIPAEPALLLAMQLRPLIKHDLWLDGRAVPVSPYATGALTMLDLRARPVANLASNYECVQIYMPRTALDSMSDVEGTPRFGDLPLLNGAEDPVLAHLAHIARAAVCPGGPATSLFIDALFLTAHRHLRARYAGVRESAPPVHGGLAPWQEARAKEYIDAHLDTNITLLELALQCQLSVSWFGRAFKISTGMTPHRWLISRRLARARNLMVFTGQTLTEIAQQCGFADQSHLAREFRRMEGAGPAEWRRAHAIAAD